MKERQKKRKYLKDKEKKIIYTYTLYLKTLLVKSMWKKKGHYLTVNNNKRIIEQKLELTGTWPSI